MNLLHLEYFRELAYSEHMQKTAEKMHVSTSGISACLRSLEQELGVLLFDRVGRNIRLNNYGRIFLPYVEQVFQSLDEGKHRISTAYMRHKDRVSFSIKDAAFWNQVIMSFNQDYPEISLYQYDSDPDFDGKLIDQLNLDFMVTDKELINSTLDSCNLYKDTYVLMVAKNHPLARAGKKSCSLFDLQDETFLLRPKSDYFQQCTDRLFSKYGFHPKKSMEFEYVLRSIMLEKNAGVVITAGNTSISEFYNETVLINIHEFKDEYFYKRLYWRKDKALSPTALSFKSYLEDVDSHRKHSRHTS